MVGLVIAAHGKLAEELLSTAAAIVGPIDNSAACSVKPGLGSEELRGQIKAAVKSVDQGDGVLVLADLFGGSPCTQSLALCGEANLEVLTGINLPMVLKATQLRGANQSLASVAAELAAYGQKNITCASQLFRAQRT